jgi:hypothetical protein
VLVLTAAMFSLFGPKMLVVGKVDQRIELGINS